MKFTLQSFGLTVALGLTAGLAAPAMAQNADTQANPLADFQSQTSDPFASNSDASKSMMNLMQRVMQGDRPDPAAFAASQQENMNDAMANFRAKQMQLIKARQAQLQPGQTAVLAPAQVNPCIAASLTQGSTCVFNPQTGGTVIVPIVPPTAK